MAVHAATKVVVITEAALLERVASVVLACGATGYTAVAAGGQGARGKRPAGHPGVSDVFANVKIEVITADRDRALRIAETVAAEFFDDYAGVTYLEPVEILRPHKFA